MKTGGNNRLDVLQKAPSPLCCYRDDLSLSTITALLEYSHSENGGLTSALSFRRLGGCGSYYDWIYQGFGTYIAVLFFYPFGTSKETVHLELNGCNR